MRNGEWWLVRGAASGQARRDGSDGRKGGSFGGGGGNNPPKLVLVEERSPRGGATASGACGIKVAVDGVGFPT
jgi:hypothetical protein